ncbi:MAG: FtsX-like permease family protein [Solobacterium sp.]|nr:FtsX-like permease family protein [Solobacterium sp.]
MNFFQRAIKNITRRKTKSILLLITFFVIGNFVIIGLGVSQASQSAKILTRQKMRAVVTYSTDWRKIDKYVQELEDEDEINKFYENYPRISITDVQEMLKDERVRTANAVSINPVYANEELDFVHLGNQAEENRGGGTSCYYDDVTGEQTCVEYIEPNFLMKGNYFPDMIEFADGGYTISEGRFYTQDDLDNAHPVVLVTRALADHNNLRIGDTITLMLQSPTDIETYLGQYGITLEDVSQEFEIIGIFEHNTPLLPDAPNYDYASPFENPDNMMLIPNTAFDGMRLSIAQKQFDYWAENNPEEEYYQNPDNRPTEEDVLYLNDVTLLLNDPLEVDSFVEEYNGKVGEFFSLSANNEEFQRLSKPLDTLSLYAKFIVWLVVINAVVIITLVTALTLKNREYEIGVLLSIGASKAKIVAQFFIELAIVAILGFTLSIVSGSVIANKVGQTVLDYQIASSGVNEGEDYDYYDYNNIWDTDYSSDVTLDDLVSEYNVSVSPLIIAEIYVVGLGIVLVSTIIPSMMIMRFNPKRILMNQN